jgi:hypothetical protein
VRRPCACALWASLVLAPSAVAAGPSPAPIAGETLAGELTRIDLVRRSLAVKTEGRDPREVEAMVTDKTQLASRGRAVHLEDLRPGDRLVVVAVEEGGTRQARLVKVLGRSAIAPPSPARPSPSASGPTPGTHS